MRFCQLYVRGTRVNSDLFHRDVRFAWINNFFYSKVVCYRLAALDSWQRTSLPKFCREPKQYYSNRKIIIFVRFGNYREILWQDDKCPAVCQLYGLVACLFSCRSSVMAWLWRAPILGAQSAYVGFHNLQWHLTPLTDCSLRQLVVDTIMLAYLHSWYFSWLTDTFAVAERFQVCGKGRREGSRESRYGGHCVVPRAMSQFASLTSRFALYGTIGYDAWLAGSHAATNPLL